MTVSSDQLERLQATVAQQEAEVYRLEAEIAEIQQEIDAFQPEYDQRVAPLQARVDAARAALNDLESLKVQRRRGVDVSLDAFDELQETDYGFASAPMSAREREEPEDTPHKQDDDLKTTYRRLARRYHPDLANDEDERAHRTELMAMINRAYAENDMDTLRTLETDGTPGSPGDDGTPDGGARVPLETLRVRELQQRSADLAMAIQDLRYERDELLRSPMMDLKIQVKLAWREGRDLLAEMADDLRREYRTLQDRIRTLRHELRSTP